MTDEFFSGVDKAVETLNLGASGARLDELVRLSRELISALDVEQAMAAAGEAVRQVCDAERFVVLLVEPDGTLAAKAARDAAGVDLPLPPPLELSACEHARTSGEVVHSQQARWKHQKLCGLVAVPMQGAHGCVGVLYADGETRFLQRLDEHAQEMLLLLASHAAMAVSNHGLMAQVQATAPGQLETGAQFERRLHDELKRATRYARPFSIVYVDMVDADAMLARYDLAAIDELIVTVADAVAKECRASDMVARIGPARVGVLLPEPTDGLGDAAGLRAFAERLRDRLQSAPLQVRGTLQKVGVLLGGVSYQQAPLLGLKGVLHEADLAIDVARRDKTDCFVTR